MSFFYLNAVKGDIPVHLLETVVMKRLEYLESIVKSEANAYNEYVVEGSVYDVVGHYTLCIVAILEGREEFKQYIIRGEDMLFMRRLKALSAYDLRCFAKKLLRIIRKLCSELHCLKPLRALCRHLMLRDMAHHVSSICAENCSVHTLSVSFKHCLAFVAKRQVVLENGVAHIPCSKWKDYLLNLFHCNLKNRLYKIDISGLRHDPRVTDLLRKVGKEIAPLNRFNITVLRSLDVDVASKMFPPCMLHLHQHLRNTHRLTHDQRFYYSLFLKDLGMPVEEAIMFWREEYQKPPNGKSACCHNWAKDEKKFVYGIRHMYGLEGGRKEYSCRNCHQIQNCDTVYSEGGCPFKSFDDNKMEEILNISKTDPVLSQINELRAQRKYTSACVTLLQNRNANKPQSVKGDGMNFNFTPLKYYLVLTNSLTSS
ncbi:DNA primase large subunit-like [Bicyclus anynana]|uniref:DNA primase large subunit-like n=1 Tax=Bicyclus anynana TaxID=110368 RepID=A0A6J1MHN1_BICAN|nr:DNA primase large subunit-like [Bicyclus anynana]